MTNDFHATDPALAQTHGQVEASLSATTPRPAVHGLNDEPTHTATFAMHDPRNRAAAVIDSVIAQVGEQGRTVAWILETPGHAAPVGRAAPPGGSWRPARDRARHPPGAGRVRHAVQRGD